MDDKISKRLLFLPKNWGSVLFTPWLKAISTHFQPRVQRFVTDKEQTLFSKPVSAATCPSHTLRDPASSPTVLPDVSQTSHLPVLLSTPECPLPTPWCGQVSDPVPTGFSPSTPEASVHIAALVITTEPCAA